MNCVKKYIQPGYFASKPLLEVGCGYADVGAMFYELGADVTSSDAREEHLKTAAQNYPHLKLLRIDADRDQIEGKYDVIVHWGLLYHLKEIDTHLETVARACDVLLLETEVSDSDDPTFSISTKEDGDDQAFNSAGIRPSQAYVESVLKRNGFQVTLVKDPILNTSFHCYDWEIQNTKSWKHGLRRFWICWKDVESPLVECPS